MRRQTPREYADRLRRITPDRLTRAMSGATERVLRREALPAVRAETLRQGVVATGQFLDAWRVERDGPGEVSLRNLSPHAGVVEYGRRPGRMPPIGALVRWVEIRLGKGGPEAIRAAWGIAHRIAQRGTRGRGILRRVRQRLLRRIRQAELAAAQKILSGKE